MNEAFVQVVYLAASALFILGLRSLTRPEAARRGMQQAAMGMLFAIVGTMVSAEIVDYRSGSAREWAPDTGGFLYAREGQA